MGLVTGTKLWSLRVDFMAKIASSHHGTSLCDLLLGLVAGTSPIVSADLNRPQRVCHPPKTFTYNTLGQPTICSVQTGSNLVPGWSYPPFQSPWMLPMHQYHPPPCYGPLVYPPYMQMMYAWCTQIYLLYWTFINVVVRRIMIVSTVKFPVFCAAVSSKQAK